MVQKPKRRRLSLNCWHFSAIWDRDVRFPPNESWNILVFVSFMPCVIILWNHVWKPQLLSCQTFFSWKILQISSLPIPTAGDPNSWCFWLFLDQFWHNTCLKICVRKSWVKLLKFLRPRVNSMPSTPQPHIWTFMAWNIALRIVSWVLCWRKVISILWNPFLPTINRV